MEVNRQLGHIMLRLAQTDIQKNNVCLPSTTRSWAQADVDLNLQWEEGISLLRKAIGFLRELKSYLHNLVYFYNTVHNFVSLAFKDSTDQFISVIEHTASGPRMKQSNCITLDACSREVGAFNIPQFTLISNMSVSDHLQTRPIHCEAYQGGAAHQ